MPKNDDGMSIIMSSGIDPEVLKILYPTRWQKVLRFFNRIKSHIRYRLGLSKF